MAVAFKIPTATERVVAMHAWLLRCVFALELLFHVCKGLEIQ